MYIYIDLTVYFRALVLCFGSQIMVCVLCLDPLHVFGRDLRDQKTETESIYIYIYIYKRILFSK